MNESLDPRYQSTIDLNSRIVAPLTDPLAPPIALGWDPTLEHQHREPLAAITFAPCSVVDSEIPRRVDLKKHLPRATQGEVGQCAGFSAAKALMGDIWIDYQQCVPLSGSFQYLAGKSLDQSSEFSDSGASIGGVALAANRIGVATEEEFPSFQTMREFQSRRPSPEAFGAAAHRKIRSVCELHSTREVVQFIGSGQGFCLFGTWWVADFANYRGTRAIRPITDIPRGSNYGGHALAVMGYRFDAHDLYVEIWNHHPGWGVGGQNTALVHEQVFDWLLSHSEFGCRGVSGSTGFRKRKMDLIRGIA